MRRQVHGPFGKSLLTVEILVSTMYTGADVVWVGASVALGLAEVVVEAGVVVVVVGIVVAFTWVLSSSICFCRSAICGSIVVDDGVVVVAPHADMTNKTKTDNNFPDLDITQVCPTSADRC